MPPAPSECRLRQSLQPSLELTSSYFICCCSEQPAREMVLLKPQKGTHHSTTTERSAARYVVLQVLFITSAWWKRVKSIVFFRSSHARSKFFRWLFVSLTADVAALFHYGLWLTRCNPLSSLVSFARLFSLQKKTNVRTWQMHTITCNIIEVRFWSDIARA